MATTTYTPSMLRGAGTRGVPEVSAGSSFSNTKSTLFDGINDYVDCGTVTTLNGLSKASWSFWMKVGYKETNIFPFGQDEVGINNGIRPSFTSIGGCDIYLGPNRYRVMGNSIIMELFDEYWHNIVITFNRTNSPRPLICTLYIDSLIVANNLSPSSALLPTLTEPFNIGRWQNNLNNFGGNIDEFAIWDTELRQPAVTELYNNGIPNDLSTHPTVANLKHWWRMGEDVTNFPTIPDKIGSNNGIAYNENEATMIVPDVPS